VVSKLITYFGECMICDSGSVYFICTATQPNGSLYNLIHICCVLVGI
jgi:hypothetical protein